MRLLFLLAGSFFLSTALTSCAPMNISFADFRPVPPEILAKKSPEERQAIARIAGKGGRVILDEDQSHFPVVTVNFMDSRGGDLDLMDLKALPELRTLVLQGDGFTDAGLDYLVDIPGPLELWIVDTRITGKGLGFLHKIPNLRKLHLMEFPLGPERLVYLQKLSGLEELTIQDCPIGDKDLEFLKGLHNLRKFHCSCSLFCDLQDTKELHFDWDSNGKIIVTVPISNPITDAGLANFQGLSKLEDIELHSTGITSKGLENFAKCRALRALDLEGTRVNDEGLAFLADFPDLETLDLRGTDVTNQGLVHVAKMKKLRVLRLGNPDKIKITTGGLFPIADLGQLEELTLQGPGITDMGLKEINPLPNLRKLILNNTQITDQGLEYLANLSHLETLTIQSSKEITKNGLEQLKYALPGLKVELID